VLTVTPPPEQAQQPPAPDLFVGQSRLARRFRHGRTRGRWRAFGQQVPLAWRIVLALVAGILVSNVAIGVWGSDLTRQSDAWGALSQLAACEDKGPTPDVVIMGSSRAQAGIAPPVLSDELSARLGQRIVSCDMAVTTSIPVQNYLMLHKLLADGIHPRFVIYATADYEFNSPVAETNVPVLDNLEYLATPGDLPDLMRIGVGGQHWNNTSWALDFAATQLVRAYGDRRGIQIALCGLAPQFGPCPSILPAPQATSVQSTVAPGRSYPLDIADGWYPLPEATTRSLLNSQAQYQQWLSNYQVSPDALSYLGKLVDLCHASHIGIVLVNMPMLPQQLAFYPVLTDYLTYIGALYRFSDEHGVPFYDEGLGLMDDRSDFADTNHLDYWGALSFTGWLAVHVVEPEFQRQVLG
jgi:hypothetical protein